MYRIMKLVTLSPNEKMLLFFVELEKYTSEKSVRNEDIVSLLELSILRITASYGNKKL